MNTEDQLTAALDAAAETITADSLRHLPEPRGRTSLRWLFRPNARFIPAAAAAGVVAAVTAALVLPAQLQAPAASPRLGAAPAAPAGPPPYYAQVEGGIHTSSGQVAIRATATGAVTATVPNPPGLFALAVTTADDRTFYAIYRGNGGDFVLYRFTVAAGGAATTPVPVPGGVVSGQKDLGNPGGFAVSPDGTRVAFGAASAREGSLPQEIVVVSVRTGARAVWRGGLGQAGSVTYLTSLGWTGDSRTLIYLAEFCPNGGTTGGVLGVNCVQGVTGDKLRQFDVTASGGRLSDGSSMANGFGGAFLIPQAVVEPDGVVDILTEFGQNSATAEIDQVEGSEWPPVCKLPASVGLALSTGIAHLTSDSTGRYLLLSVQGKLGAVYGGRYHPLPSADTNGEPAVW